MHFARQRGKKGHWGLEIALTRKREAEEQPGSEEVRLTFGILSHYFYATSKPLAILGNEGK